MNRAMRLWACAATCAALAGAAIAPASADYPSNFQLTKVKGFHVVDVSTSTNVFKPAVAGDEYTLKLDAGAQFQFDGGGSTWYSLDEVAGFFQIYDAGSVDVDRSTNTGWSLEPKKTSDSRDWLGFDTPMATDSDKSLGLFPTGSSHKNAGTMHEDGASTLGTFVFGETPMTGTYTGNIAFGFHIATDTNVFGGGNTGFVYFSPSKPPEEVPEPAAVQLASLLALSGVGLWRARARRS